MEKWKVRANGIRRSARWMTCVGLLQLVSAADGQVPHGVFSLFAAGQNASEIVLANPDITGVTIRQDWAELEPSEGNFDWSFLDGEIARVSASGKQILLRINTQAAKPAWVTAAVEAAGGQFFTFDNDGVLTTIPVFWDPTFLARKKAMITAVGAHVSGNSAVRIVAASFANATSEDWNVPHTELEVLDWLAAGYTSDKLLDAGRQIIDTTMAAFPNQLVTLAIGGNGHVGGMVNLDPSATYVAETAIATTRSSWPGRLIAQINSLSTFNPVAPGPDNSVWHLLWSSQPAVAAQVLYWCYDEPTYRVNGGIPGDPAAVLTACVDAARTYGVNYIEIYQKDVLNLPSVVSYAHDVLVEPIALLNVSTRLQIGMGDNVAISGFIVTGTGAKRVMLRAIGPSLGPFGIAEPLADPRLELHDQAGNIIATNDDWESTEVGGLITEDQTAAIRSTALAPSASAEAVVLCDLDPGIYTAVIRGAGEEIGVGLAEIYDLSAAVPATVGNLSTRGRVDAAENLLIGGFIVGGQNPAEVVVRALGPSLKQAGVVEALEDPALDLRDANGTLLAANDNWADSQELELEAAGLAPSDSRESAIRQALPAGNYTATVTESDGGAGLGLVEIYRLP